VQQAKDCAMRQTPERLSDRMTRIEQARRWVLDGATDPPKHGIAPWIARSWQRCLANGQRPQDAVGFDLLTAPAMRRVGEANHTLVSAAKPVLTGLGRALADTGYFALLTNADGVVIDAQGSIDRSDPHAQVISRIGVDLSERSVGTTAISAALTELQAVWLHRGEHFYDDTSVYSCAGAPLIGPQGDCVGMLDLTGVRSTERPQLRHLVAQSARAIENALTLACAQGKGKLLLWLNWASPALGTDSEGMVCLDADGWILGANPAARQMLALAPQHDEQALHSNDLFAMPYHMLFDAARTQASHLRVPLWSGLHLVATPQPGEAPNSPRPHQLPDTHALPLKALETSLIKRAVEQSGGNVAEAARALGISRATVYRKLGVRTGKF